MIKLFSIIMLLIVGMKYTLGWTTVDYFLYSFAKSAMPNGEGEQEKSEQEKCKTDHEDKIFSHSTFSASLKTSAIILQHFSQQDEYLGFLNSPVTPPPEEA